MSDVAHGNAEGEVPSIFIGDETVWQDLTTYLLRTKATRRDAVVRCVGVGANLAAFTSVAPAGLPISTLALRVLPVAKPWPHDVTCDVTAWNDRLARRNVALRLPIPPVHAHGGPELAQLPKPSGWIKRGHQMVTANPSASWEGSASVTFTNDDTAEPFTHDVPTAVAHTAYSLGFVSDPMARVYLATNGTWSRYVFDHGFVMTRTNTLL